MDTPAFRSPASDHISAQELTARENSITQGSSLIVNDKEPYQGASVGHCSLKSVIERGLIRYYIILLIRGTLIYRVAESSQAVHDLLAYDDDLPDVIPLGFCNSQDWSIEWQVEPEIRQRLSGKVLSLINYIRLAHYE